MKYVIVVWRSFLFYTIIAIAYRIMGKREMGELSIMDFIVSIFMAEIVAISIENYDKSIFLSLLPILFLVGIEILISHFSMKNRRARNMIEGVPSMIISHGKVNFQEMKKQRYNLDDLLAQLRMNSIKSIEEIDYALLETSGKLSIFKREEDPNGEYPLPLILDGEINKKVLKEINRTNKWLEEELKKQQIKQEEIFYAFYRNKSLYIITNSQIK
ncbi:MAG: DUF421 domain-containing protein [Bacilli bacterium]|nr:DUF421 domain-containing protein [Bacilli bacterium]